LVHGFDARTAINRLLKKPIPPWQRPIILRGLLAWSLNSRDEYFTRDTMIRYIGDLIAKREAEIKPGLGKWAPLSIPQALFNKDHIPILVGALFPLGGFSSLMEACSAKELRQARNEKLEIAKSLNDVISVVHLYGATQGKVPHHKKLTPEFACDLVSKLQMQRSQHGSKMKSYSVERLRTFWNEHARSCALLYADHLTSNDVSIYHHLVDAHASYSRKTTVRWLKVSKAVTRLVRKNFRFQQGKSPDFVKFPKLLKGKKLPPPKLHLCEALWLVNQFQDQKTSWKNVYGKVIRHTNTTCVRSSKSAGACTACGRFAGKFDGDLNPVISTQHGVK